MTDCRCRDRGYCACTTTDLDLDAFEWEPKDPEYPWSRKWVILNTAATIAGAFTGLVALVVAVIALTS